VVLDAGRRPGRSNYLSQRPIFCSTMMPRVVLHNAVSADGRIDWFGPDIGLYYELASIWGADAVLSGSETIRIAEELFPESDEPMPELPQGLPSPLPLLVVPDSRGRIRTWQTLRRMPYWRDVVVLCSRSTPEDYMAYLNREEIDSITAGDDHVDLHEALEELNARYGIEIVRVDSGGTLNGALLRAGLVDEVSILIHPVLVGGTTPRSFFRAPDLAAPDGVVPLRLISAEQIRDGIVWLRYEVECGR
jgi:2,5-diamino-6-(ribosylamino)-4(3H)-pyrimidinone 5'-phosphate reductase